MLSRGALCRLAANAPKTSTHDLPRLSHHLQSSLRSANGLSPRAFYALSRAYKAALSEYRRSYATAAATKPTTKVKRDVKKAVAKKPVKKPAAKKAATKKKPKKAAAKKAKPKKKPVAKPKRKVLTPEQKEKEKLANLKNDALRAPVTRQPVNAYAIFISENLGGAKGIITGKARELATKFKNLTPAEREHYNHLANEKTVANFAKYDAWILTHTPDQIRVANNARQYLKRKLTKPGAVTRQRLQPLRDDRQVTRPMPTFARFTSDRTASGDFKGIPVSDALKLIASEWKALSANEKKKYEDAYAAEKVEYLREYQKTYGHAASTA